MGAKEEQLIAEMEKTNIFMTNEMTFVEYTDNLMQFQEMVTKMVMGEAHENECEWMRLFIGLKQKLVLKELQETQC